MDKGIEKSRITQPEKRRKAKGGPGAEPRWTSGAKTIVGTSSSQRSRIWFTVNNGVVAEIYHPDVDQANTRGVRFLVTGPGGFFSDELWDADHRVEWLQPGVPGCRIQTHCKRGSYSMSKEIVTDPLRDVLLLRVTFTPAAGQDLRLYLVVDPHIGDQGADNHAWAGAYKGVPMLFAGRGQLALALATKPDPLAMSVGYVGTTDAYTVLSKGGSLPDANTAEAGSVAIAAEIDLRGMEASDRLGCFTVALACGGDPAEAGLQARAGLLENFERTRDLFVQDWREEQAKYDDLEDLSESAHDMYRVSTAMLQAHQSKRFPGGFVASLSLPWGFTRTDKDVGGYHVVWPRDLVEIAMGKLASGDACSARSALFYLACTQAPDGGWSQNMWLDGTPNLNAIQMDGIALPILLANKLRRDDALDGYDPGPMVRAAAVFVLRHGPVTQQDRWETMPGYSPYSMAVQVAALLAAADYAEERGHSDKAQFLRETADAWNDSIDELTYVQGTRLARKHGVQGYYVRMAPPERIEKSRLGKLKIYMPNRPFGSKKQPAVEIVSPDALALVRFGLRSADDPRLLDTVKVLDATLRVETRTGPTWTRCTKDGYGETSAGAPFKKTGVGRGWPLLGGERGHYEIAAGHREAALELLKTMARQTSECGLLPEQVWNVDDIPTRELYNGRPTGSGMPLVWAHAEYVKLLRSLHENGIWDQVPQAVARYVHSRHPASFQIWSPEQRRAFVTAGKDLRLDLPCAAKVFWHDGGKEKGPLPATVVWGCTPSPFCWLRCSWGRLCGYAWSRWQRRDRGREQKPPRILLWCAHAPATARQRESLQPTQLKRGPTLPDAAYPHPRWAAQRVFAVFLGGGLLLGLASKPMPAQERRPLEPPIPEQRETQQHRTRLILKDGSYQSVLSYRVVGTTVHYRSAERDGAEEDVPLALVDLSATKAWARAHEVGQASSPEGAVLSPELAREEAARAARTPEVAKDLRLPEEDSVLVLDEFQGTPELVPLPQQNSDLNRETAHAVLKKDINPQASPHDLFLLKEEQADVQLHIPDPVFFVRLEAGAADPVVDGGGGFTVETSGQAGRATPGGSAAGSRYVVERVDVRRGARAVSSFLLRLLDSGRSQPDLIETRLEPLPGGQWERVVPRQPLAFGEYVLVEVLNDRALNSSVWDFGVHPTAKENDEALRPEPKRPRVLERREP